MAAAATIIKLVTSNAPWLNAARRERVLFVTSCAALCGLWLVLALRVFPAYGFYSPDSALKWLQVKSLRFAPGLLTSLVYPGRSYDPALLAVPFGPSFFTLRDNQVELVWAPWFALISWPFHAWLGVRGMRVIPALAAFACALATALGAQRVLGTRARLPALGLTAFATPLLVYGVLSWEHAPAAALAVFGFWQWIDSTSGERPWSAVRAGGLLALACALRTEVGLLCAALCSVGVAAGRSERRASLLTAAALLAVLTPFALWNAHNMASLLPANAARNFGHASLDYLRTARLHALAETAWGSRDGYAWAGVAGAAIVMIASRLHDTCWRVRGLALGLWTVAIAALTIITRSALADVDAVHGLLEVAPWWIASIAVAAPVTDDTTHATTLLRRTIQLYALFYVIAITCLSWLGPSGGREWGPRFLLPLFPLSVPLLLLQLKELRHAQRRSGNLAYAASLVLVVLSVHTQLRGLSKTLQDERHGDQLVRQLSYIPAGEPVVTTEWWVPTLLAPQYEGRPIFLVREPSTWNDLLLRMLRDGRQRIWLAGTQLGEFPVVRILTIPEIDIAETSRTMFDTFQLRSFSLECKKPELCASRVSTPKAH